MFAETHGSLETLGNNSADESWGFRASQKCTGNASLEGAGVLVQTQGSIVCVALARTAGAGQTLEFSGSHVAFGVRTESLFSILFPTHLGMDLCTTDPVKWLLSPDPIISTCSLFLII